MIPIWKDTVYSVSYTQSPFTYSIEMGTGSAAITVFNGKAWAAPEEPTIDININKVCRNYLDVDLPDLNTITTSTTYTHPNAVKTFVLKRNGTSLASYDFVWDWSYDENRILSKPINGKGTSNMFYLKSEVYNNTIRTNISLTPTTGYNSGYCGEYAVYYLNTDGGWDSFLIEGKVAKTEEYNKYSIENHKGIRSIYDNEITTRWEIHTGWLNDSQSKTLFENLLPSNNIFLHDLVNDIVYKVVNTEAQGEHKTYRNEKNLISYQFNLESASKKKIY